MISALNGVIGDHLRARENGLAIEMGLYHRGQPLACEARAIAQSHPLATGKLCVLVHGLSDNERIWSFPGDRETSYGTLLARDLGYTPFHVRYNTGLHISENGECLARLLEDLVAHYPARVRELVVIGHSMGGLVARSACHAATLSGHRWLGRLTRLFYIASPHMGAPLEKLGNVVGSVLRAIRNPYTRLVADVIDLRSDGIKDLRYANLVAADWQGFDPDALLEDHRTPVTLPPHVAQYALVGTLTADERHVVGWMLGDGLVRVGSATGRSSDEGRIPQLPQENVRIFGGVSHRALAHHPAVYEQIRAWCAEE